MADTANTETQTPEIEQPDTPQGQEQQTTPDWVPKRMSELAAARRAAEQRAEEAAQRERQLQEELAKLRANPDAASTQAQPTSQNVEELAKAYAQRMVTDQLAQQQFVSKLSDIETAGKKEYGDDFDKALNTLNMAGVGGMEFLNVLVNIPNAEKVLAFLGKPENVSNAINISTMTPTQMAVELTKLSTKAAKSLSKQVSKAPPPGENIDGSSSSGGGAEPNPKTDPKGWIKWRNENARRKR